MVFDKFNLEGKVAIVTGGSRGIGLGISKGLAEAGANIAIVGRNFDRIEKAVMEIKQYGHDAIAVQADISNLSETEEIVISCIKKFGKIDILVNNAGIDITRPSAEITEQEWNMVLDTNLKGTFFCCQSVGRVMIKKKYGKIVSITSILSEIAKPCEAAYAASKGGIVQMTKVLAVEWAPFNITVNAIGPGSIPTDLNKEFLAIPENYQTNISKIPMKHLGTPEDIAAASIFLASDASNYVTGQIIYVDGGWLAM